MLNLKNAPIKKQDMIGYLFVLPSLLAVILFSFNPIIQALIISFQKHNGVSGSWIGLYNYKSVLEDKAFWIAMQNTLYMGVLGMVLGLPISLIIASLVNRCGLGRNFLKSVFFLPNVTSIVAASLIFMFIFAADPNGLANIVLQKFGLPPSKWFAGPRTAGISVILMGLWHTTGYNVIIWMSGLQSISRELYEASDMDGATRLQQWRYITIPGLRPIIVFMIVMGSIGLFKRFGDVYVVGGQDGSPAQSLLTLMLYVYRTSFGLYDFGAASAASYIVFVCILTLTIINFKLFNEKA